MQYPRVVVNQGKDQHLYLLHCIPAEDLRDLSLEFSPGAVHFTVAGLSIDP
jgi:hypothetical protein